MASMENPSEIVSLDSILSNAGTNSGNEAVAALCNDASGLCLGSRGAIDTSRSGLYTKIIRLASQLDPYGSDDTGAPHTSGNVVGGKDVTESRNAKNTNKNDLEFPPPFVSIETDLADIFVKEYDGHTIVLRMPTGSGQNQKLQEGGSISENMVTSSNNQDLTHNDETRNDGYNEHGGDDGGDN